MAKERLGRSALDQGALEVGIASNCGAGEEEHSKMAEKRLSEE